MANYAVLNGNNVENTIVAESLEIAEAVTGKICVEYTNENPAGIGWTYDGEKFVAPDAQYLIDQETNSAETE
jgi:hypothetical protein